MLLHELKNLIKGFEKQLSTELKKELDEKLKLSVEAYPFNEYEFRLKFLQ